MRHLFTWLLLLGVLAGLNARVIAADEIAGSTCCKTQQECCADPGTNTPLSDHHHHDDGCPLDHHHCSGCIHTLPLAVENDFLHRLTAPEFSLSHFRHESEVPPDGPFPALDKPPLI